MNIHIQNICKQKKSKYNLAATKKNEKKKLQMQHKCLSKQKDSVHPLNNNKNIYVI